jgi:crotonobetainyl-CoA:carnitine CoA-transferase CaiB-like acyl-CoA transferase
MGLSGRIANQMKSQGDPRTNATVLLLTPDKLAAVASAIGRPDLLTDPRFSDPAKVMANMPQLTAILDEVFCAQLMAHWYEVLIPTALIIDCCPCSGGY